MTHFLKPGLSCSATTRDFPVVATVVAVAGVFGEALVSKYVAAGRGVAVALALGQAIPVSLLVRNFIGRASKPDQRSSDRAGRGR